MPTVQLGNYNRKTGDWSEGLGYPKTGNRSIDHSWVFFEVVAKTQADALERVKAYCANPKAKFTGMHVTLTEDKAILGNQEVILL